MDIRAFRTMPNQSLLTSENASRSRVSIDVFLLSFKVLKDRIWSIINILSKQLEIESKAPDHQCQFYAYVSQRSPVRSMPPADTMQSSIDGNFSNLMVEI
jgi:hypothetical protein